MGFADMTNTEFSPLKPLLVLLKEYAPNWPDSEIQSSLEQWKRELDTFDCREFFAQVFRDVNNSKDQSRLDEMVEKAREHMMDENNYNGALVRYVIGQVIEREAGLEQKKRYWKAVLSGKVA